MFFHLHLIPLESGADITIIAWPSDEQGHFHLNLASHLDPAAYPPLRLDSVRISFALGTFAIELRDDMGALRVNGKQVPPSSPRPLHQGDVLELGRSGTSSFAPAMSALVDFNRSEDARVAFPGPYTYRGAPQCPDYAWSASARRSFDDAFRGSSGTSVPAHRLPAFSLGPCTLTTTHIFGRKNDAPYPLLTSFLPVHGVPSSHSQLAPAPLTPSKPSSSTSSSSSSYDSDGDATFRYGDFVKNAAQVLPGGEDGASACPPPKSDHTGHPCSYPSARVDTSLPTSALGRTSSREPPVVSSPTSPPTSEPGMPRPPASSTALATSSFLRRSNTSSSASASASADVRCASKSAQLSEKGEPSISQLDEVIARIHTAWIDARQLLGLAQAYGKRPSMDAALNSIHDAWVQARHWCIDEDRARASTSRVGTLNSPALGSPSTTRRGCAPDVDSLCSSRKPTSASMPMPMLMHNTPKVSSSPSPCVPSAPSPTTFFSTAPSYHTTAPPARSPAPAAPVSTFVQPHPSALPSLSPLTPSFAPAAAVPTTPPLRPLFSHPTPSTLISLRALIDNIFTLASPTALPSPSSFCSALPYSIISPASSLFPPHSSYPFHLAQLL